MSTSKKLTSKLHHHPIRFIKPFFRKMEGVDKVLKKRVVKSKKNDLNHHYSKDVKNKSFSQRKRKHDSEGLRLNIKKKMVLKINLDKRNCLELYQVNNSYFLNFRQFYSPKTDREGDKKYDTKDIGIGIRSLTINVDHLQKLINNLVAIQLFHDTTDSQAELMKVFEEFKKKISQELFLTSSYYKNRFYLHIRLYKRRSSPSALADEDDSNDIDASYYPTPMGVVYNIGQFPNLIAGLEKILNVIVKKDYENRSNPEPPTTIDTKSDSNDSENEDDIDLTFTE